jgi:phosphoglycolate phosphatase-like HAD superfamily hydrolase
MDEQACEKAGTDFIYAAYGFGTASHPTAVIHSLKDLLQIL